MLSFLVSLSTKLSTFVVTFALAGLAYVVGLVVYRLFYHPLAKYPGPLAGKLTPWYAVYEMACGRATYTRVAQHRKYGRVVRMGPNELSFSSQTALKDLYGQSSLPCLKAAFFYHAFTLTGLHSVFALTNRTEHARVRRLLSHGYSEQSILQFENQVAENIRKFITNVGATSDEPIDMFRASNDLFLDVTSDLSFDKAFGVLDGIDNPMVRDIQTYFKIAPLFGFFPLAKYLPFGIFKAARDARSRIIHNVQELLDQFRSRLAQSKARQSLLRSMVEARDDEDKGSKLSDMELIENAVIVIIAGSETTATTLTYVIYELGKRPEMQRRLEQEIRTAFPDPRVFPDYKTASKLDYLSRVIQETLRLHAPANTAQFRTSPGKSIDGEYVPAGTLVSSIAYGDARHPSVFADPEEFHPDRWIDPSADMKMMHRPFSMGPRNCIGMHQARMQLMLAACGLFQRFDLRLDPSMNDQNMAMRDLGLMSPIGGKLLVWAKERRT